MKTRILAVLFALVGMIGLTVSPAHAVYRQAMCTPTGLPSQANLHVTTWIDTNNSNLAVYHVDMDSYSNWKQIEFTVNGYRYTSTNDRYVYVSGVGKVSRFVGYWSGGPDGPIRSCTFYLSPW